MPEIKINLDNKTNELVRLHMAKKEISSKAKAVIDIIQKYFKINGRD